MQKTQRQTSKLGPTDLEITRVGLGAWAIGGGGWELGWGPRGDEEPLAATQLAVELGVSWIDAAAAYGFGRSKAVVGRALAGLTDSPYVLSIAQAFGYERRDLAATFHVLAQMTAHQGRGRGPHAREGRPHPRPGSGDQAAAPRLPHSDLGAAETAGVIEAAPFVRDQNSW